MKQFTSTASSNGLADELRKLIANMPGGARLPTVRQLMSDYGVSQHLVQSALTQLRTDGSIASFVGRGTFVGTRTVAGAAATTRSVLTLVYDSPYERSEVIASSLHRALIHRHYESMIVTYHDHLHAMDALRGGRRYDACVLQPRMSVIRGSVLALLRDIGDIVIIEGQMADGLDVDGISNDPGTCVELALRHLLDLGHRRIAWVTEQNEHGFFRLGVRIFETARSFIGLGPEAMPVVIAPMSRTERNFEDLAGALRPLFGGGAASRADRRRGGKLFGWRDVLGAFEKLGLDVPRDVSVIKVGTPDVPSDHIGRLTIVGRPTFKVTESVLARLEWRWRNRSAPFETVFDQPVLATSLSTAPPPVR